MRRIRCSGCGGTTSTATDSSRLPFRGGGGSFRRSGQWPPAPTARLVVSVTRSARCELLRRPATPAARPTPSIRVRVDGDLNSAGQPVEVIMRPDVAAQQHDTATGRRPVGRVLWRAAEAFVEGACRRVLLEHPEIEPGAREAPRAPGGDVGEEPASLPRPWCSRRTCRLSTCVPQRASSSPKAHANPTIPVSSSATTTYWFAAGVPSRSVQTWRRSASTSPSR